MATRDALRAIDAQIMTGLSAIGLSDEMVVRGQRVTGYYRQEWVERGDGEDAVAAHLQVFDARVEDMPDVVEGDVVDVVGHGQFRVLRPEPDGTGRVMVVLGSFL